MNICERGNPPDSTEERLLRAQFLIFQKFDEMPDVMIASFLLKRCDVPGAVKAFLRYPDLT